MEMTQEILEAILDAYPYQIVYVDRNHIIQYLNKAAQERYGKILKPGDSIMACHNEKSRKLIEEFLARADAGEMGEMFEASSATEREFFVPVRNTAGEVIGYFERHENLWSKENPKEPVQILPLTNFQKHF